MGTGLRDFALIGCVPSTTAQPAQSDRGTAVSSTVVKNLLVAANRCAEHDGHDPPQLAFPARSRIACAMLCAHDACFLASLAAPQPDLRPRSACSPYGSCAKSGAAPDTRGLPVVSISVRPRYRSAGLVKWYPFDDTILVFDESFILRSSFFSLAPLLERESGQTTVGRVTGGTVPECPPLPLDLKSNAPTRPAWRDQCRHPGERA